MIEKTIQTSYTFGNYKECAASDQFLLDQAIDASKNAYAPHSKFRVGAAIRTMSGNIRLGNNQENAAFPSGLCAERVALYAQHAIEPNEKIDALAVYAPIDHSGLSPSPCGACRQVMIEYENLQEQNYRVLLINALKEVWIFPSVSALIPLAFNARHLSADRK